MVSFPSGRAWVGLKIHHHIGDRHQLGSVLPFGNRTVLAFWFTYYMTKPLGRFCWLSVQIQIQLFVGFVIPYYVTEVLSQNLSLEKGKQDETHVYAIYSRNSMLKYILLAFCYCLS